MVANVAADTGTAAIFILAAEIEHDALNLKAMHIQSGNTTLWRA